jgi:hypothetical protein
MALELRYVDQLALSLFDKEASYDAGPGGWLAANACQMSGFEGLVNLDDAVVDDKEGVTHSEHPTIQMIAKKGWALEYTENRLKPHTLAGLASLHFGSSTPTKDGTFDAWRHKIVPVAAGTALPSIGCLYKEAGSQFQAKGIKSNTLTVKRNGDWLALTAALLGSGTRATDATDFPAIISESWLRWGEIAGFWLETGADISINATPTQGGQAISSGTPDDLTSRLLDFNFVHNNNLRGDLGYGPGGGLVRSDLEAGLRDASVTFKIKADDTTYATELAYYEDQDDVAIHLAVDTGTVIATGGSYKWGFDIIIPLLKLKPVKRDVEDDYHVLNFEASVFDDGTNDEVILYVYNAEAAYLA